MLPIINLKNNYIVAVFACAYVSAVTVESSTGNVSVVFSATRTSASSSSSTVFGSSIFSTGIDYSAIGISVATQ